MQFISPEWLYCLLFVPVLVVIALLQHRARGRAWRRLVANRLEYKLVSKIPSTRRWLSLALGSTALAFSILALARPYHGEKEETEQVTAAT